ncbi:hypothetical protein DVS28_b0292 (plasmid) [Euzebya pacifica]|uniref:Uncharacterized protein n=1 Tax=Euzebya pacifica TaxID=1608957 RepID=A0A346Y6G5_9ACTN|nr:hypothetical protein [Euzebya pacifica]AXV10062.1 hypothetical protein DVS28_b0292 [Euzebya pacifica]
MTAPLALPGLLPLRGAPGPLPAAGRVGPPSVVLANACYVGDRDMIGRHAFDTLLGTGGPAQINHSPVGPWLALAASRIDDPDSVTAIHAGWTDRLSEALDLVCVEAYAHGIVIGADLDAAISNIWSAAFLVEMHDFGGVCALIDALVEAEIVWVARQVAQACHAHNGRYNELAHLVRRLGYHGASDTRGFTGWNVAGAVEGARWSARPDAPAALLAATAARYRRLGGNHLHVACEYGFAAVLDDPTDDYPLNGLEAIARDLGDTTLRGVALTMLALDPATRLRRSAIPRSDILPVVRRRIADRWEGPE